MKIDRNIISTLHIVFSLCARVGWCENSTEFTKVNKSRCRCKLDVPIKYWTRATFEEQLTALQVVRIIIFSSGVCLICWQKCGPKPKLLLRIDIFSTLVNHIILTYLRKSFIPDKKIKQTRLQWYLNSSMIKHKRLRKITFSRHRKHTQNRPQSILIRHSS